MIKQSETLPTRPRGWSKREISRCAEDKGNRKAAAVFGVGESNVLLWRKHKAAISGCEASRKKFTEPKKGRFP